MPSFVTDALIRLAVLLPVMLIVAAGLWFACRKAGMLKTDTPFTRADLRTWPLRYVLADAALFAVVYAIVIAWLGDGDASTPIAGALAAATAIGIGPHMFPLAS